MLDDNPAELGPQVQFDDAAAREQRARHCSGRAPTAHLGAREIRVVTAGKKGDLSATGIASGYGSVEAGTSYLEARRYWYQTASTLVVLY